MKTKLIEATNGRYNHGKFLIGVFDQEWRHRSVIDVQYMIDQFVEEEVTGEQLGLMLASQGPLLRRCGWGPEHFLFLDLETGEGAMYVQNGHAHSALDKHKIWVCPLYEAALACVMTMDLSDLDALPDTIDVDAEFRLAGYRRPGPSPDGSDAPVEVVDKVPDIGEVALTDAQPGRWGEAAIDAMIEGSDG